MDYTTLLEGDSGARESAKLSRIRRILQTVGDSIQNGVRRSGGASVSNSLSLSLFYSIYQNSFQVYQFIAR